jgi:uncharacterized protein YqjF (DUF2071 family)
MPVPYLGDFCETNVRLYSVDDQDRHGIVFLTLDASRLATVLLARFGLGLPYAWSAMRARREGDRMSYHSTRRWPGLRDSGGRVASISRPHCPVTVQLGPPTQPSPTEVWLTARWGLHSRVAGRSVWVPNEHGPWPLHEASVLDFDSNLVQACGIEAADTQMLRPLWSPGVRTRFGLPTVLSD